MEAFQVAGHQRVSPWDALASVVSRRAERVRWTDSVISQIIEDDRKLALRRRARTDCAS